MSVSQIDGARQIKAASIANAQIDAAAGIALTKLAKMPIAADGSSSVTANIPFSNFKITGLSDGSADTDSCTVGQARQFAAAKDWKDAADVATTANVNLASALANGQVIDGVTLVTGMRVLVKNQTTGSQNGIYDVPASGAASRSSDADTSAEVTGGLTVTVRKGTQGGFIYTLTTDDPITLNTTSLVFTQTGASGSGSVTTVSVVSANGFAGSVATSSTTPAITITTTITGLLKGNGTAISAATAGTDYYAPGSTDVAVADGGTGVSTLTGIVKGNGTSAFTAATASTDYMAPAGFVTREVPSGTKNGSNATFTLANTPLSGSEEVYLNGALLNAGAGNDYTISTNTLTMLTSAIPVSTDVLLVNYRK